MEQEMTQVWIGRSRVGLLGLRASFEEVRSLGLWDDEAIKGALLLRVGRSNYIPPGIEPEYGDALLREYRRFFGEPVGEGGPCWSEILVLGPGCPRCDELERRVMAAVSELGLAAEVRHVRDVQEIASYGLMGTPALVVNGVVKTVGRVPSVADIRTILTEEET